MHLATAARSEVLGDLSALVLISLGPPGGGSGCLPPSGKVRRLPAVGLLSAAALQQNTNGKKSKVPGTRFRPDTRLDRGGHYVGSHGGWDGSRR